MLADPTGAFTAVRFVFDLPTILMSDAGDRKSYENHNANASHRCLSEPCAVALQCQAPLPVMKR